MAEDRKRPAKSETLTIRLNPRTRFVLEFVARMRGQTITTVVERALEAAGDQARVTQERGEDLTWKDFWDVSEGVRSLKIASEPELFPTYDEEVRLAFCRQWKAYFYRDLDCREPSRPYIEILWPKLDYLIRLHDDTKTSNFFAVEKEMRGILNHAGIKPPESRNGVKDMTFEGKRHYDLDDEIPF